MIYKVKKYPAPNIDRRQLLDDAYAKGYAMGSFEEYEKQDFWQLLEKTIKKDCRYLDVGCGIGGWNLFLSERGYRVEGIDESARVLRAMTEFNPDIVVAQGSLNAVPYADQVFDGVLAIGSLDHVEHDVEGAMAEISRVIKPGGVLFLEMPLLNTLRKYKYVPLKKLEALVRRAFGQPEVFAGYFIDKLGVSQLLEKHGFTIEHMQPHDLPGRVSHYGLYADWPFFRGEKPYQLNVIGRLLKSVANAISPWLISTGIVVVARKK